MGCIYILAVFFIISLIQDKSLAAEECGGKPADVFFLVDASNSVWGPDFDRQLSFIEDVVDEFDVRPENTRCSLITFSDYVRMEFDLKTFPDARGMRYAIDRTSQLYGGTRTDLALARMRESVKKDQRSGIPKLAIVMTDGESTYPKLTKVEAELAHEAGITVFAIGIGNKIKKEELQMLASSPEYVFEVDTFEALQTIRKLLAIKACEVEEELQGDGPMITAPTKGCDGKPADVVFALDASASIWKHDFDRQLTFIKDVVSIFEVSNTATRIGILTFGNHAEKQFYLHKYTDPEGLAKAIGKVKQTNGNTNTASAIRAIRNQFFSPRRAREGVVHIAIIITDGRSDNPVATAKQARLARKEGIHMFAVGVGQNVDIRELYKLASEPAGQYVFEVATYDALGSIKNLLAMKTCEVTEAPTKATPPVTKPTPPAPEPNVAGCGAQKPADIVFALPGDASALESNQVLKFIRNITNNLDIDSDAVRFGLLPKHCYTVPGLSLKNGGGSKDHVISMISSSKYVPMDAKTIIKHMCDNSFNTVEGGRENSKKIGVLFVNTDNGIEELLYVAGEAERAREQQGVEFLVIGVGKGVSENELSTIVAPHTESNILIIENYDKLKNISAAMTRRFDELCLDAEPSLQLYHL